MWLVEGTTNKRAMPFLYHFKHVFFQVVPRPRVDCKQHQVSVIVFRLQSLYIQSFSFVQPIIFSTNENCVIFYKCDHVGRFPDLQTQPLKTFILFSFKIFTNSLVLGLRCYVNIVCNGASQQYIYIYIVVLLLYVMSAGICCAYFCTNILVG